MVPVGKVTIDTTKPDGTSFNEDGTVVIRKTGVAVTLATTMTNPTLFANSIKASDPTAKREIKPNGTISETVGGTTYAAKPDLLVTKAPAGTPSGFANDKDGNLVFTDTLGNQQKWKPTFADSSCLKTAVQLLLGATASPSVKPIDGTTRLVVGGVTLGKLTPEFELREVTCTETAPVILTITPGKLFEQRSPTSAPKTCAAQRFGVSQ